MNTYYRRPPWVASRVVGGEAFIIKMPENVVFVLNGAASRVWVRADGTRSGEDLTAEWDREASQAFLDEAVERGLLERSPSPRETSDVFPQEITWPAETPAEPPGVRLSEAVAAIGGCGATDIACDPQFSA